MEALALIVACPRLACRLQESNSAEDVVHGKEHRRADGAVYMALSSEVHNAIDMVLSEDALNELLIADVALHKGVVGALYSLGDIVETTRVGELVECYDVVVGILRCHKFHNVAANKACTTRNKYIALLHNYLFISDITSRSRSCQGVISMPSIAAIRAVFSTEYAGRAARILRSCDVQDVTRHFKPACLIISHAKSCHVHSPPSV